VPETFRSLNVLEWWFNGKHHRGRDLPAVEWDMEWWFNGKHHRGRDLPAVEYVNGKKVWKYAVRRTNTLNILPYMPHQQRILALHVGELCRLKISTQLKYFCKSQSRHNSPIHN